MSHRGTLLSLPSEFKDLLPTFQAWLEEVQGNLAAEPTLSAAICYSLSGPGKRIRPLLALAVAELCELELQRMRSFCLSLEFIHTSSLIHDDLPALDNDDFRRGLPTLHREFDEAVALLAGDLLLAQASLEVSRAPEAPAEVRARWAELVSEATVALCEGQMMDLRSGTLGDRALLSQDAALNALRELSIRKTGALFRAAALGPAALVQDKTLRERYESSLEQFAVNLGLLFQITDDILDHQPDLLNSTAEGEGSRSKQQTLSTYVSLLGITGAEAAADCAAADAIRALADYPSERSIVLRNLVEQVRRRDK